jgi:hypothetical protein
VYARRSSLEYEPKAFYRDRDLSRELNHESTGEGIDVRYALTPLTTFSVNMAQQRDRFVSALDRNSDSLVVIPSIEFKPFALVSGRASFGYQRRKVLSGSAPDFNGTTALVDLTYTFRGRTRFDVGASRALEYSFLVERLDYVQTRLNGSVTQRIGDWWDVGASMGRARLTYLEQSTRTNQGLANFAPQTYFSYGLGLGFTVSRTRVGIFLDNGERQANLAEQDRGYRRRRIGSTLTYAF